MASRGPGIGQPKRSARRSARNLRGATRRSGRNRIGPATAPRVTAADPAGRQQPAAHGAVNLERLHRVLRARRLEPAPGSRTEEPGFQRRQEPSIPLHQDDENLAHGVQGQTGIRHAARPETRRWHFRAGRLRPPDEPPFLPALRAFVGKVSFMEGCRLPAATAGPPPAARAAGHDRPMRNSSGRATVAQPARARPVQSARAARCETPRA